MEFYVNISVSFFKSLNIGLGTHSLFLIRFKISVFSDDREWTGKTKIMLLSRRVINKLLGAIAYIQLRKFRFKEGLKLVSHEFHKMISLIYSKLYEALFQPITLTVFWNTPSLEWFRHWSCCKRNCLAVIQNIVWFAEFL